MKRHITYIAMLLTALTGASCSQDETPAGDGRTGVMAMTISTSRAEDNGEYDPLQYQKVYIYNSEGGLLRKYAAKDDIPERLELLSGTYRVAVEAGEEVPADFSKRFYKGEETFTVKPGETTHAEVVCKIANTVVEVKFDASIVENLDPGYFVWIAGTDKFDEAEAESGAVPALKFTDEGTGYYTLPAGTTSLAWMFRGTHTSGKEVEMENTLTEVKAGGKYVFTFRYSPDVKFGKAAPAAKLTSTNMLVLAAGNLFTGTFAYKSFTGTVQFGQPYDFTVRPSALKVKYHAKVGTVDKVRTSGDICPYIKKGDPDMARIFVAIVDWNAPHQVVSAMTTTKGAWDPEKGIDNVSEGKILGYGSLWITQSTEGDDMQDAELDIVWYDHETRPSGGGYSLVISCACNAYGDYFTGCSTNVMYVDDFEWVY